MVSRISEPSTACWQMSSWGETTWAFRTQAPLKHVLCVARQPHLTMKVGSGSWIGRNMILSFWIFWCQFLWRDDQGVDTYTYIYIHKYTRCGGPADQVIKSILGKLQHRLNPLCWIPFVLVENRQRKSYIENIVWLVEYLNQLHDILAKNSVQIKYFNSYAEMIWHVGIQAVYSCIYIYMYTLYIYIHVQYIRTVYIHVIFTFQSIYAISG